MLMSSQLSAGCWRNLQGFGHSDGLGALADLWMGCVSKVLSYAELLHRTSEEIWALAIIQLALESTTPSTFNPAFLRLTRIFKPLGQKKCLRRHMHYQGAEKFLQIAPNISKIAQQWPVFTPFPTIFWQPLPEKKQGVNSLSFLTQHFPHGISCCSGSSAWCGWCGCCVTCRKWSSWWRA